MQRNVLKLGSSSLVVSLPKSWINNNGVLKGSFVNLEVINNSVCISLTKFPVKSVLKDVSGLSKRSINATLYQLYRQGNDIINLKYSSKAEFKYMKSHVNLKIPHLKFIESKNSVCTFKIDETFLDLSNPEKLYNDYFKKMIYLIKDHASNLNDIFSSEIANPPDLSYYRVDVDIYSNILRRVIAKYKVGGDKSSFLFYSVSLLTYVSHSYDYMYKHICSKKLILSKSDLDIFNKVYLTLEDYFDALFKKDILKLDHIMRVHKDIWIDEIFDLMNSNVNKHEFYFYLLSILRNIQLSSTVIFGF